MSRVLHRIRVAGDSMTPTLEPGELLLVDTRAYRRAPPRTGDVVLAMHPDGSRKIIKRVVEPPPGVQVGASAVYLRGDNPAATTDSDHFGPLERERLLGRIWFSASRLRRVR